MLLFSLLALGGAFAPAVDESARATLGAGRPAESPDHRIRRRLLAELERQPWWNAEVGNVHVERGVVHLQGLIDRRSDRHCAQRLAASVQGVRAVRDHRIPLREWQSLA